MKKLVFFDIDGTLLDHNKKLPSKTKMAIEILKRSGVKVAIATGRAPFMFEPLRKELGIDSFVSFNGQYVVFEKQLIYANPLNKKEIQDLCFFAEGKKHPLVFMDDRTMKATVTYHKYVEESFGSLRFPHPEKDESYYLKNDIYQTLLFCETPVEDEYRNKYDQFRFVRWHPFGVDVLPSEVSKAIGVKKLVELMGFELQDVYAFGDGLNDIEMLQTVGTGVAMGNASGRVKEAAKLVTKDVAENGIWYGLKELGLI